VWSRSSAVFLIPIGLAAGQRWEWAEPAMGTLVRITAYAPNAAAVRAAFARVHELDDRLSDYKPDSEVSRLSGQAGRVRISEDLFRVLSISHELASDSEGAFDVTLGPLVRLWRRARAEARMPSLDMLERARAAAGFRKLRLRPGEVELLVEGMALDLGGIAKGFAASEALAAMQERGATQAMVAVGGDLAVGDPPPGAAGWRIAIRHEVLTLSNTCISTSGDTEQFAEIGGVRYSHIIDPRTGIGLRNQGEVTVIAPSGALADGLATALGVMDPEAGRALLSKYRAVRR
jgi:thiamine biosynthesis lipoprotein